MAGNSKAEYQRRINRVMDYISKHLGDPLSLETLADVAAFSPFHFHRVFKSMVGENLSEYIQRTRLEKAASALVHYPHKDITEIALAFGFASSSAFAHAFKGYFGVNATEWRDAEARNLRDRRRHEFSKINQFKSNAAQAGNSAFSDDGVMTSNNAWPETKEEPLKVAVKNLPEYRVAYMRNVGPYGPSQIPKLWDRLMAWAGPRGLVGPNTTTLGISHDDPNVTAAEKCRYDACIVVPKDFAPDPKINLTDVPGGQYAVTDFVGTPQEIMGAWHQMFSNWLPNSGYQPDSRPCYERYPADVYVDAVKGAFRCEICIPVRPL